MFILQPFFSQNVARVLSCDTIAFTYNSPMTYHQCVADSNIGVSFTYSSVNQTTPTLTTAFRPFVVGNYAYFLGAQSPTTAWKRLDLTDYTTTIAITPSLPALSAPKTGNFSWPWYDGVDTIVFAPYNDYRWYLYNINTTQTTIAFTHSERVNVNYNQRFNSGQVYKHNDKYWCLPYGNNSAGENYQAYVYSYDPVTKTVATGSAMSTNALAPATSCGASFAKSNDGLLFTSMYGRYGTSPYYKYIRTLDLNRSGETTATYSNYPTFGSSGLSINTPVICQISATQAMGWSASTTNTVQAYYVTSTTASSAVNIGPNRTARTVTVTAGHQVFPIDFLPCGKRIILQSDGNRIWLYDLVADTYEELAVSSVSQGKFWYNNKLHIQTSTTNLKIYTFNYNYYWNTTRLEKTNGNSI